MPPATAIPSGPETTSQRQLHRATSGKAHASPSTAWEPTKSTSTPRRRTLPLLVRNATSCPRRSMPKGTRTMRVLRTWFSVLWRGRATANPATIRRPCAVAIPGVIAKPTRSGRFPSTPQTRAELVMGCRPPRPIRSPSAVQSATATS